MVIEALWAALVATLILGASLYWILLEKSTVPPANSPPVVTIPDELLFGNPRKAYESAIKQHGPVVGVRRKGRLEYIVDGRLAHEILTNDSLFSFEQGTLRILNLMPLLHLPRSFIAGIDKLVHEGITPNLDALVAGLEPIFRRRIAQVTSPLQDTSAVPVNLDLSEFVQTLMAESMTMLLLGEAYMTPANIAAVEKLGVDIATISGIYQNLSWWSRTFPGIWRIVTWIRIVGYSIPRNFVFGIGWSAFMDLSKPENESRIGEDSLLHTWSKRYRTEANPKIRFADRIWLLFLLLGKLTNVQRLIFASVHQTAVVMVWVVYELAKRPEEHEALRSEFHTETDAYGRPALTYASLRNAEKLDSFIREVLRTKGDTLSTIRQTTAEAPLCGYVLPAGSLVIPLATLAHEDEDVHGEDAKVFDADRWVGRDKPAIKVGPGYWPFGMGRWACPGRNLAVAEIKLLVLTLIMSATPVLKDNTYKIVDSMNTTSVPPRGEFMLARRQYKSG